MTVTAVLRQLKQSQINLRLDGTVLHYSCPAGALTDELRRTILDHKPVLVSLFSTVAEIARSSACRRPTDDNLPKTPWFEWYLDTFDPREHGWAIGLVIKFPGQVMLDVLRSAVLELIARHDAFRLRLSPTADGNWTLCMAPNALDGAAIVAHDLSDVPDEARLERLRLIGTDLRQQLNIVNGPVLGVAICTFADCTGDVILLVIHHNIVDGYSVQLIARDLIQIYQTLLASGGLQSRSAYISYKQYLTETYYRTQQTDFVAESVAFWLESDRLRRVRRLPVDHLHGRHTTGNSRRIVQSLDSSLMRQLGTAAASRGAALHELILHAVGGAFHRWTNHEYLRIDFEHHGRDVLGPSSPLTETVGPMTVKVPVLLNVRAATSDLKAISIELRDSVEHGLGYGFLRYCCQDPVVRQRLTACRPAQVLLNNRLSIWRAAPKAGPIDLYGARIGQIGGLAPPGKADPVSYDILIECDGSMDGAVMTWTYSGAIHRDETVRSLASAAFTSLSSLTG